MNRHFSSTNRSGFFVGLAVLAFAGILAWQTALIPHGGAYAHVGPTIVPWMVTALLAVLGIGLMIESLFQRAPSSEDHGEFGIHALSWLVLGLLLNLFLIAPLGFIIASSLLFVCTARAFGSTRLLRDAAIGFTLALIAYIAFDRLLGYRIGGGLIENLF